MYKTYLEMTRRRVGVGVVVKGQVQKAERDGQGVDSVVRVRHRQRSQHRSHDPVNKTTVADNGTTYTQTETNEVRQSHLARVV